MKPLFLLFIVVANLLSQNPSLLREVPAHISVKQNPMANSDRARQAGAKLFSRECSSCHGTKAEGSEKAPALRGPDVHQASDSALFWILKNGSLRHGMPSFAHLPEPQRWQIITFLRSLYQREE